MSVCIPCAKEIINGDALAAWRKSHKIATMIPDLVESGRMESAAADKVLEALIAADRAYIEAVAETAAVMPKLVRPLWPKA